MDLRHDQLPWNEQIWAKINADLAHALAQARRVRAPFEVFHVPESTQTVMADRRQSRGDFSFAETESLPVIELSVAFRLKPSQVFREGENFYSLDRVVSAAHDLGLAEDALIMRGSLAQLPADVTQRVTMTTVRQVPPWDALMYSKFGKLDLSPVWQGGTRTPNSPLGLEIYNAVIRARARIRANSRHEPFAVFLSNDLEGELQSTIPGSNSLNTPIERMRSLATAGMFSTPVLDSNEALVVAVSRAWVDIAQAMEPSIQFLSIAPNGEYQMRLIERFSFRLKDRSARCKIIMNQM